MAGSTDTIQNVENVACYLCGETESTFWASENGFNAVKCAGCGMVYTNPRPRHDEIDEAAQTGMHRTDEGKMSVVGRFKRSRFTRFRRQVLELFRDDKPLPGRTVSWLDVGAGFGELVMALKSVVAPDSRLLGVEPCTPKVEIARQHGLPVESRRMEDVEDRYQYVSLINVYSHLPDPIDFLRQLGDRLVDGGEVVLLTGNGGDVEPDDFPRPLYLPDHLSFAGVDHLRAVLDRAGYDVVTTRLQPFPRRMEWLKNIARRMLGKPPFHLPRKTATRDVWIRAVKR